MPTSHKSSVRQDNMARAQQAEVILKWGLIGVTVVGLAFFLLVKLPELKTSGNERQHAAPQGVSSIASFDQLEAGFEEAIQQANWTEAQAIATRAEQIADESEHRAAVLGWRAEIALGLGQSADAVAWFLKAIRLAPENADYYRGWAGALRQEGHAVAALAPMQRAVQLAPEDFLVKSAYSLLLIEAGRSDQVANVINEKAQQGQLPVELGFAQVALLQKLGRGEEADKVLGQLQAALPSELYEKCLNDPIFQQ